MWVTNSNSSTTETRAVSAATAATVDVDSVSAHHHHQPVGIGDSLQWLIFGAITASGAKEQEKMSISGGGILWRKTGNFLIKIIICNSWME